jgi:hypothetical protein
LSPATTPATAPTNLSAAACFAAIPGCAFRSPPSPGTSSILALLQMKIVHHDDRNTRAAIAGTGIACPNLDAGLLTVYFDYFIRTGFLPPPPKEVGAQNLENWEVSSQFSR